MIEQLPVFFQPPDELFCVRATYVLATNGSIIVYNEARKDGVLGEPVDPPDMVAHHDDLPQAQSNQETAASKLRVGFAVFDFLYAPPSSSAAPSPSAASFQAQFSAEFAGLLPPGDGDIQANLNTSKLIEVLKAILFSPVRALVMVAYFESRPTGYNA